ncbi:MAG: HNH endonuclease signature motif containing protein [Corynebacterium sp.]|nr:HNH endonuclease signature motif containing protein [Corynebacterium sp.]
MTLTGVVPPGIPIDKYEAAIAHMSTMSTEELALINQASGVVRAKKLYEENKKEKPKKRIRNITENHNVHANEARSFDYAGAALHFPMLGTVLLMLQISVPTMTLMVLKVRALLGDWEKPAPSQVHHDQLVFLRDVLQGLGSVSPTQALNAVRVAVRDHNEAWKAKQRALREAEYEEARAELMATNPEAFDPANLPAPDVPEVPVECVEDESFVDGAELSEPRQLASDRNVRLKVSRRGRNDNEIRISGLSDFDTQIFQNGVKGQIRKISAEDRSKYRKELIGQASALFLRSMADGEGIPITMNVSVNMDILEKNPDFGIFANGRNYSAEELADNLRAWGNEQTNEAFVLHDQDGLPIGYSKGRFGTAVDRAIMQTTHTCCAFPYCNETVDLQAHHLLRFKDNPETRTSNIVLVCERHHIMITHHENNLHIHWDLGTAVWWDPQTGHPLVGTFAGPQSAIMQAHGTQRGLDPLVPEQWVLLRKMLVRDTWKRIKK